MSGRPKPPSPSRGATISTRHTGAVVGGTCAHHTTVTNCHPFPRQLTDMAREDMAAGAGECWIRAVRGPWTGICRALMTDEGRARLHLRLKTPEPGHGDKVGRSASHEQRASLLQRPCRYSLSCSSLSSHARPSRTPSLHSLRPLLPRALQARAQQYRCAHAGERTESESSEKDIIPLNIKKGFSLVFKKGFSLESFSKVGGGWGVSQ
jgi:hypothetical protein